ncbi:MAG: FtsW/RodA/SpoVE family cell cycle protein [Muribaculaceae bacterium]|nr:FtsW/RodA/SpoVE family cell cycle protein [Muribaculaceae bacterium]
MEQTLNQQPTQSPELEESKLPKTDKYILGIYILLLIVSVIELYSASSFEVRASNVFAPLIRHGMMLVAGILIVLGLSRINYRWFIPLIPLFVIFSVCLAGYVLVAGEIINGARRSITMLGITFQAAEFPTLSAVLSLALIMSRSQSRQGVKTWGIITSSITVLIFGGLLFPQGLTNTLLLMGISLSMMLIGGIQWRKFFIVLGCYAVIAGCGYIVKAHLSEDSGRTGTWKQRVERYFDKSQPMYEKEITSINRQEMYGYMAQAHGGIVGVMPGNSRETSRLPLAFSDYIFSIVVEDLGLVGGCALLLFYLSLMARAGNIARQCKRAFPALLVIGMAVMIVLQALFHMAIVTGVFPVSGQPLPLISKGGSSILITSIAFGIMLSVSRFATQSKAKKHEYDPETELLPEEVQAINPMQID